MSGLLAVLFLLWSAPGAGARVPLDPRYSDQRLMWEQIGAPAAWDLSVGSKQVIIASIDTGADIWHDDLRANIWTNPFEAADNGLDDDGNGYVDDEHGWNFVENNNDVRTSVLENKDDPEAVRHGTIIAGLIGAVGDNNLDGTGVNWHTQIMPLRAINSQGNGKAGAVIKAIEYAINNGARVITMSFLGSEDIPELREALRAAYERGIVIAAAAGNERVNQKGNLDQSPAYPACFDRNSSDNWVLGVSAVNARDELSGFASYGSCADLAAPGEDVFSTERYAPQFNYHRTFGGGWKGTSFATPLVAGSAALIAALRPDWGAAEIINTILSSADEITVTSPGAGPGALKRLNLGRAAAAAQSLPRALAFAPLYYQQSGEVLGYDFTAERHYLFGLVREAELVSFARGHLAGDALAETALLIRRGRFFYLRLLTAGGAFWREFSLAPERDKKTLLLPIKLKIAFSESGEPLLAVAFSDAKKIVTRLVVFDLEGARQSATPLYRGLVAWDIVPESPRLVVAALAKGKLIIRERHLMSGDERILSLPSVIRVGDLKAGRFGPGREAQAVLSIRRGQREEIAVGDFSTNSFKRRSLPRLPAKAGAWQLALGDANADGRLDILAWLPRGGPFTVWDGDLTAVSELTLPALPGKLE